MTKQEKINQLAKHLSVHILLESMVYSYMQESYEEMKEVNPILANLVRKDIETMHRNHNFFFDKFKAILSHNLFDDFDHLRIIIENFLNKQV